MARGGVHRFEHTCGVMSVVAGYGGGFGQRSSNEGFAYDQQQQGCRSQVPALAAKPTQKASHDILAGNLEELSQHLQKARICQSNKLAPSSVAASAVPASPKPDATAAHHAASPSTSSQATAAHVAAAGPVQPQQQQQAQVLSLFCSAPCCFIPQCACVCAARCGLPMPI